ncbi:MAG TPA: AAA family ATPase [Thermoleophilaceae bacterium]
MSVQEAPLVERERELEALRRLTAAAREGAGGALVIEGAPGIGKSSLLAAACDALGDLRVVGARGGRLERELPFGIVRQLLEPVLTGAAEEEREALLAGAAALAEPVLRAPAGDGAAEPAFSALHGLYWLTVNLAGRCPLCIAVDDVQWADVASLRWLVYLVRRLEGVPLALLMATRPAAAGAERELLDELCATPGVGLLQPGDLSEAAVTALVTRSLSAEPDPEFAAACHAATGGNPFLLRELLGELARDGVAPTAQNAEQASRVSSQGVGRAVRRRLSALGPESTALVQAVAVLCDPVELEPAARLAGMEEGAASRMADRLAEASILEPGRPLAFVHSLVRASVEAEMSAGELAAKHEAAAAILGEMGEEADWVALHLLESPPRGHAGTVATLRHAAADASGRGAPEVAVTYLRRAVAEPPPADMAPAVAHELGEAALRANDLETAIERLREATRGLPDGAQRARAADSLGSTLTLAHRPDEAVAALSAVIEHLPESAREPGLRLQATRWAAARASVTAWGKLRESGDRFAIAASAEPTIGERLLLGVAAFDANRERTAAEARDLALAALADGALVDDPGPEAASFWFAPIALLRAEALADAARVCGEVIEAAKRHGSLPGFSMAAQLRAFVWWRRGVLDEAEADAASALEEAVMPGFPPYGHAALANVQLARGRVAEAEETLARTRFEPHSSFALYYLQVRGRVRAATGRTQEALEDMLASETLEADLRIATPAFSTWRSDAAPLLSALGRHDEALELAREEHDRCRAFGAAGPLGAALRTLGALEGGATGIALLEEAVAVLERSMARLEHGIALIELGAALRRDRRRADARPPLREGLDVAVRCGAEAVALRAHDELVASGARPRRDPIESRGNLTAGELRVARMAAGDMTNREIAQALFLTENTIQTHLRSVFRKLDIRSRSQLARALEESGPPADLTGFLTDAR